MKYTLPFLLALLCMTTAIAQRDITGYWKGYISQGDIHATTGLQFELYLIAKGAKITGRSYTHQADGTIIEMEVQGELHSDRSISLYDIEFIPIIDSEVQATHTKKYQFKYNRSMFLSDNTLDGYWQEIIETPFYTKRRRGKVFLQKIKHTPKA